MSSARLVLLVALLSACGPASDAAPSRAPIAPGAASGGVSTARAAEARRADDPDPPVASETPEPPFDFGAVAPPARTIRVVSDVVVSPSDAAPEDSFGWSLAVARDGSRVLVSNHHEANQTGSARVFTLTGSAWIEEARLVPGDARRGHAAAWSVALSAAGDRAVLGAYGDGRAHVFARTGSAWREEATLVVADVANECELAVALAPDGTRASVRRESECALAVAIDAAGSRVIVGSHRSASTGGVETGLARVFVRSGSTWSEEAALVHSGATAGARVGWSVAISGDARYALVGSCRGTGDSVRVFSRGDGGWVEDATLGAGLEGLPPSPNLFTASKLALDDHGARAVIGVRLADEGRGAALVFVRSATGWTEESMVREPDGRPMDQFGASVAIDADGTRILVGGPMHALGLGVARLFLRRDREWVLAAATEGGSALTAAGYGTSVALAGDASVALIGAYGDDVAAGRNAGSVHVLTLASTR